MRKNERERVKSASFNLHNHNYFLHETAVVANVDIEYLTNDILRLFWLQTAFRAF